MTTAHDRRATGRFFRSAKNGRWLERLAWYAALSALALLLVVSRTVSAQDDPKVL
jgi:hypothetical protein